MRVLALDAALAGCSAALVSDGRVLAELVGDGGRGHSALLPALLRDVLRQSGVGVASLDAIAVTVGPGSFTGLRAALALACGLALGLGRPVVGVTVAEALGAALPGDAGRLLWTAIDSRRGRVFLDIAGRVMAVALDDLPQARGRIAVAGDAAIPVAARLAARDVDVKLTDARRPLARHVATAALRRLAGDLPPLPARPLYVDPPEAKLPAGGLRPPPAGSPA